MPSEWAEEDEQWTQDGAADPASAVPPDVAASMQQYIEALTTPETELEQQILEEVERWAARHDRPPHVPAWPSNGSNAEAAAAAAPAAAGTGCPDGSSRCLAGSSIANSRCSSPSWSYGALSTTPSGSSNDTGPGPATTATEARTTAAGTATAGTRTPGTASSSGRSSEEGSSAAWRLCSWLQRVGYPVQHCASIRNSGGWQLCSGHEFLLLYPDQFKPGKGSAPGSSRPTSSLFAPSTAGSGSDSDMPDVAAAAAAALVIDPEFSTQFALAAPTPRYQVLVSLLPRVFVGTYDRLQQLVEWVCREMHVSFSGTGSGLPPWRSLSHVLGKWRLHAAGEGSSGGGGISTTASAAPSLPSADKAGEQQGQEQQPAAPLCRPQYGWHPVGQQWQHGGGSAAPSPAPLQAACAAFSPEQQQAMLKLLLQQEQQAGAPTAGDNSSAPPAGAMLAQAQLQPQQPRSLLTQELNGVAAAAKQPGPAAAILSMTQRQSAYPCSW